MDTSLRTEGHTIPGGTIKDNDEVEIEDTYSEQDDACRNH